MPPPQPNQQKQKQKRRKRKWRDKVKVVPVEPVQEVSEQTLTLCQRCPEHRNRQGKFRLLINDGCFLCDACYRHEFPATAMLDEESNFRRNVKDIQHNITNAILDHVAEMKQPAAVDAAGANGDSSSSSSFPSEIECRMCLERGFFRNCCESYYCHQCYFKSGRCPKCNKETPLTGLAAALYREDPGRVAVGLSWLISTLIVVITVAAVALLCWNASTFPVTLSTNQCRGWLPTCNLAVCIEHNEYEESGLFLPATQPYKDCDRSTSAHQVIASGCVYDWEAYVWSNHSIGYDLCVSSPREEQSRSTSVSSSHPLLLYSNDATAGVYVFDDDFEFPLKEASAPWQEIINGKHSDACGINHNQSERGNHGEFSPPDNKNALVFGGKQRRHAATKGLNVQFGGTVEFHLKLGPLIQNDLNSECQAAFEGDVILEYNADNVWTTMGTYPAWKYRGEAFQFISEVIPRSARSNSTQFRIRQPKFDEMRDHWAIDDFRVLSRLSPQWQDSEEYKQLSRKQSDDIKLAQCCLDTNQCSFFDKKRISFDSDVCENISTRAANVGRRLKVPELLILFTVLAAVSKVLYRLVSLRFTRIVKSNHELMAKDKDDDAAEEGTALFPRKKFSAISSLSWQYCAAFLQCGMMLLTIYRLISASMLFHCMRRANRNDPFCRTNGASFYISSFAALCIDARMVGILLTRVFFVENPRNRKALEVEVDLHPDRRYMRIGTGIVPVSEITELQAKSRLFCWFVSSCYILGGLPLALGSLTIQSFELGPAFDVLSPILGSVALLREVFGPSLLAKFWLCFGWVFAFRIDDRKEFGRALRRRGLLQQSLFGSFLTPVVVMFTLLIRRVEEVSSIDNLILFILFYVSGGLFGLLVGIFRGLPTTTCVYFTSWPRNCYAITYYEKVRCPCIFSWNYCGEIHSRQVLLIISLDDMNGFKKSLMGNLSNKDEP